MIDARAQYRVVARDLNTNIEDVDEVIMYIHI
jgi:hypothetical protein